METIIGSLIAACASIIVCAISNNAQQKKAQAQHQENISLITYKLEQLEKKVDLHNSVISRTYELEARADVIEEKIKVANNRLKTLEGAREK